MVAAAHFARMGRSLKYEGNDLESITRQFEATRFGTVSPDDEDPSQANDSTADTEVLTPLQILRKLETGGDEAQMEHWTQVDGSDSGIGFIVPAILPRHRIGVLVCFREAEGMDWRMGVIRRIGRDVANRPSVGIEILAWPSICALAKPGGQESAWTKVADGGGHGWSDAIIVSLEGRELVLPAGTFFANLDVELRSEFGQWTVRLETLLDRGPDFDRIKCTRIS
jgi:hypothetical protein